MAVTIGGRLDFLKQKTARRGEMENNDSSIIYLAIIGSGKRSVPGSVYFLLFIP